MGSNVDQNVRPDYDEILQKIAAYVQEYEVKSSEAWDTARNCLMDTLGCGLLALRFPECTKHLGPIVEGTVVPHGARVPGTSFRLDPVKAAWDIGCIIRWLDYNDTWLAAEWGHPSDNLGGILAVADHLSQKRVAEGRESLTMKDVLEAMIRKSWAAGDATSRAVRLADIAMRGEMGIPSALTAPQWGFYDVLFSKTNKDQKLKSEDRRQFSLLQDFGSYVMENILFKISFPAEFHAQTAAEAAVILYPQVKDRLNEIERIVITTHESAIRIISKQGQLANAADRDHCLQYMTAVPLIFGNLTAEHYEDSFHDANPIIDSIREKMEVVEDEKYTREYLEEDKRSIANAIQVFFNDGSSTDKIAVEYPIGHRRRRAEGIPKLEEKFLSNLETRFPKFRCERIVEMCRDQQKLERTNVADFVREFVI